MANMLSNASHKARINYNGFNLSHDLKFSSTVGELLPVFYDVAIPGDKYKLDYTLLTRSIPLNKPAWFDLEEKIDWFFVPTTQIYQFFGEFYYGISDFKTSFTVPSNMISTSFPHLEATTQEMGDFYTHLQSDMDVYFSSYVGTKSRVAELLGFPIPATYSYASGEHIWQGPSALIPCAYQKIYMDYYRDSDRETVDPESYNVDIYYDVVNNAIPGMEFSRFFTLRYHRWAPDLFSHVFVSPLYGSNSNNQFVNNLLESLSDWLLPQTSFQGSPSQDLHNITLASDGDQQLINPAALSGRVHTLGWNNSSNQIAANTIRSIATSTSPQSLRHSFALEKLLEVTRRAGKHYDAQVLAHFGVEVPTGIAGEVMFLGSSSSKMEVRDVISTADTTSAVLGQQAGKAFCAGHGSGIKFTAPSDGVIMAIYSAIPKADWGASMLDRLHSYTTRDTWFSEEFDDSGMQPLFRYQVRYDFLTPATNTNVLGYQYPFSERKLKYNRVCGALRRTLSEWTPKRVYMNTSINSFIIAPNALDGIFSVNWNFDALNELKGQNSNTKDLTYQSDPFQHLLSFKVTKASKMSAYGLPNL